MEYFNNDLIELTQGNPADDLYLMGEIKAYPEYIFIAKVYDRKSQYGLNKGRISELEVFKCGEIYQHNPDRGLLHLVAHYDRGWREKPNFWSFKERQAVRIILRAFAKEV